MDRRQEIAITEFISDRTPRPLMGPMLTFDLAQEGAALRREDVWTQHGHNARTLVKHSEFRLVLIALAEGSHIREQSVDERISLQALSGSLRVDVPTETVELRKGHLVALDRNVPFSIAAREDSELLLWLGWSRD